MFIAPELFIYLYKVKKAAQNRTLMSILSSVRGLIYCIALSSFISCFKTPKPNSYNKRYLSYLKVETSPSTSSSQPRSLESLIKSPNFILLNSVALLYGSQHLIIKHAVESYPEASLVNLARFLVSSAFFAPAAISAIKNKDNLTLKAGSELGLYTFLGFAFQAVGLLTTTASRSAFLLYLNVKLVPFFAALLYKRQISSQTWASCAVALLGTYLLSTDGGPMAVGDLWCIGASAASALFILRLETFASDKRIEPARLNGVSFSVG